MSRTVIQVENLSKYYRLGVIGGATLREDLSRWWARTTNRPDPYARVDAGGAHAKGDIWALRDISFEVVEGEILGIIGRNGAGKSTLLKILSQITAPTSGRATILGRVGSLLEVGTGFHPELTGRENVFLNGTILGMSKAEVARKLDEIVAFSEVEKFIDTPVKRYSSGMIVRLAFAVAAHLEPEILIVDEVLAVGDAAFQKRCLGKMSDVASAGRTVLFVSHNMAMLEKLCTRAIWLYQGGLHDQGDVSAVVHAYLKSSQSVFEGKAHRFPARNDTYHLAIERLDVENISSAGSLDLCVKLHVSSKMPISQLGVGLSIKTLSGVEVATFAPTLTGFVIEQLSGSATVVIKVPALDRSLAGGDYVISVWLSKVRSEYLIRVDDAAVFTLPARDVYGTGTYLEHDRFGVSYMKASFDIVS